MSDQLKNIEKWVAALESGEYKQGTRSLGSFEEGYCCLGVGATVCGVDFERDQLESKEFSEVVGLQTPSGRLKSTRFYGEGCLTDINDGTTAGFKRIAKLIKARPHELFVESVADEIASHDWTQGGAV